MIGCGSIAQESHLPAIKRIPSLRLVGVADIDESKAQAAGRKFGAPHTYSDYEQLLENEDIDAVDISPQTKYHAEIAIAAAQSGRHVLCEKPIALSLEEADGMIQACARNHVKLMIAHSRRFIPRYRIVRQIIQEGDIGEVVWATQISRRHLVEPGSWYFDPEMTYGPIAEVGIHDADLLRWMFEDDVVEVQGVARARDPDAQIFDQVFAALRFKKGAVASFEVGYVLPKSYTQYTTLEVLGSAGLVLASDTKMNVVIQGRDEGVTYPLAYSDLLGVNAAYENEILTFADSIINDSDPPVTGADARAALEIILAILESIKKRRPVRLSAGSRD